MIGCVKPTETPYMQEHLLPTNRKVVKSLGRGKTIRTEVFTIVGCQFVLVKIKMDNVHRDVVRLFVTCGLLLLGLHLNIG